MPTYEYSCRDCGQHIEVVQSFRDDPLTTCASCNGSLRKVFSPAGIIFKGSGYYSTDTRAEREQAKNGSSKSGSSESSKAEKAQTADSTAADDSSGSKAESSSSDSKSAPTTSGSESAA